MLKKYVMAFVLAGFTVFTCADEAKTYKDEIPTIVNQIGEHKTLSILGYKVNKKDEDYVNSTSQKKETLQLDTDVSDLSRFEYYLRSDGNVMTRLVYANEKVYKAEILIEAINARTEYRYPSYVRSIERQSDFYKHDLVDYLVKNGWQNQGLLENEYEKDNYILKMTHSPDYAMIVEITHKDLITELNKIRSKDDEYEEDDEYLKSVYSGLMTIEDK